MYLVTDSVTGFRKQYAIFAGYCFQIPMIVGVLKPLLNRIMIHIRYGKLRLHPVKAQGLKLQICHCSCCILGKRLVDTNTNLLPRNGFAFNYMRIDNFLD